MAQRARHSILTLVLMLVAMTRMVRGHGYMVEPPSRQSAYRFGYRTPINYDDNMLYCGGKSHQWDTQGGKCGVCGDAWDQVTRNYEYPNGRYVQNVRPISKVFAMGQVMEVIINLTQSHKGAFIFRLCNRDTLNGQEATEQCLQQHPLRLASGADRLIVQDCSGVYRVRVQLPEDLTCDQCFFQWKYHSGNDYGCFPDGHCCVGCGWRQEEFYACADIVIKRDIPATIPDRQHPATCFGISSPTAVTKFPLETVPTRPYPPPPRATSSQKPATSTTMTTRPVPMTAKPVPTTTVPVTRSPVSMTTSRVPRTSKPVPMTTSPVPKTTTLVSRTTATGRLTLPPTVDAIMRKRCLGQNIPCFIYCGKKGLRAFCDKVPSCSGCKVYFEKYWN